MRHDNFDIESIISYLDGDMSSTGAEAMIHSEYNGMTIDDLTDEEKEELDNRLSDCQGCGWTYDLQNMEQIEDIGDMCWRCAEDHYEDYGRLDEEECVEDQE